MKMRVYLMNQIDKKNRIQKYNKVYKYIEIISNQLKVRFNKVI